MGVRRGGTKRAFVPPLEIGTKKQKFVKSFWFWSVGLILAITVCLPTWHFHYKTVRFTVLESCSDELAVMQWWACSSLNSLLCLQRQVAKLANELFYYWPLLRSNNMATNIRRCTSGYGGRDFAACNYWTQTSWQAMLRDWLVIAVRQLGLYQWWKNCGSPTYFVRLF